MSVAAKARAPRREIVAGAAALALGLHLWIAMIALPAAFAGSPGVASWALATAAFAALGVGLAKRSDVLLIVGFPGALVAARAAATNFADPGFAQLAALAAGAIGYLFAASASCDREPPAPRTSRTLAEPVSRRRGHRRVYAGLAALSAAFPLALAYATYGDPAVYAYAEELHASRARPFAAALSLVAVAVWIGLFAYAFAGVMAAHRTGDRALARLLAARRGAGDRSFRAGLVLATAAALALVAVYAAYRAQG